ncbi:MAG: TonB-dependent receptor, partial [Myxococcota bacterium]
MVYFIERGTYNPYDVLVEGERLRKEVNRRTLTTREIEKIPGTFGDPVKVVQNLPGVARTNLASGDIIVRGSSPEDTRVYAQGAQVPLLFHFGGLRSVIPLGVVEQIQFQPGNFPTYYGRAMGGVLNVDLKELKPEKVGGYVDVNLFDSGVFVEAPIGDNLAVAVGGRRSYIDVVLNAVIPEDAPVNLITAPVYYDGQVLVQWRPTPAHLLRMFVFTSDDRLEAIIRNPKDISVQLDGGRVAAGTSFIRSIFEHTWTPNAQFENVLMLSNGREQADINIGSGQFFFDQSTYQAQLRDTARWRFSESTTLVAGLDLDWSTTDISIRLPDVGPPKEGQVQEGQPDLDSVAVVNLTNARDRNAAAFLDLELQAIEDLLVVPGLRVDWFESTGQVTLDPRLTARYLVSSEYAIKGGVGVFHQPPTPDELVEGFGNPELTAEWAVHYSLGAEYRPAGYQALLVDATFFFKDMTNLVSLTSETADSDEVSENYNNEGEGRVYGMELLVRHELANNFFGWISYTLSRSERLDPGETEYRLFDTDQTHIFTILGTYQLPRNWELGARWRFVSGNPF